MNFKFFNFSVSNTFRRKSTLAIAIVGTGLGTALMAVLMSLSNGMDKNLSETINLVASDLTISSSDSSFSGMFGGSPISTEISDKVSNIEHVLIVEPTISTVLPSDVLDLKSPAGTILAGVDVIANKELGGETTKITEGVTIEQDTDVIVGKALLKQAKIKGIEINIGDTISYPIYYKTDAKTVEVSPEDIAASMLAQKPPTEKAPPEPDEIIELKIVGFYETGSDFTDNRIVGKIETVRKISQIEDGNVTSIKVRADESENVEFVAEEIENMFKGTEHSISVSVSKDILGDLNDTLEIFDTFIMVIALVAAVSGGMSIFIIMLMSVMERMQEFGILKATGWANRDIISSVMIESITVSVLGSLVGLGTGYGVGNLINNIIDEEIALFDTDLTLLILSFGIVMGLLGGLRPAIKAARVSPIETLQAL